MKRYSIAFEIMIVLTVIFLFVGVVLPQFNKAKDKAKDDEAKLCMHEIQIAIEMYGVDHKGMYPEYLIGGNMGMGDTLDGGPENAIKETSDGEPWLFVSDPLLRHGYLYEYPRNPYITARGAKQIEKMQTEVGDPMRHDGTGAVTGNRFGSDCTLVGNVSCDYRFPKFTYERRDKSVTEHPSFADFDGYLFYDVWQGDEPKTFLPGEFVYKVAGYPDRLKIDLWKMDVEPFLPMPASLEGYVLCVFGSSRLKGMDVFGAEFEFRTYPMCASDAKWLIEKYGVSPEDGLSLLIPTWTRWNKKKDSKGNYPGSPFSESTHIGLDWFDFGNPNGIDDAILSMLDSGYPKDRKNTSDRNSQREK